MIIYFISFLQPEAQYGEVRDIAGLSRRSWGLRGDGGGRQGGPGTGRRPRLRRRRRPARLARLLRGDRAPAAPEDRQVLQGGVSLHAGPLHHRHHGLRGIHDRLRDEVQHVGGQAQRRAQRGKYLTKIIILDQAMSRVKFFRSLKF